MKNLEIQKKRFHDRLLRLKDFNNRIRVENSVIPKSTKRASCQFPWGIDQRKFLQKSKTEKVLHIHQRAKKPEEERRKEIGLDCIDFERARSAAEHKNKEILKRIRHLEENAIRETVKKALTERIRPELIDFKKRKRRVFVEKKSKFSKDKELKQIRIIQQLERIEGKRGANLARSRSKKKIKGMAKSKSWVDIGIGIKGFLKKPYYNLIKQGEELSPQMHRKFEEIYSNLQAAIEGSTPKKLARSSTKPKLSKLGSGGKERRKALEQTYKKLTKRLEKFNAKKQRKRAQKKKSESLLHSKNRSIEEKIEKKLRDYSNSSEEFEVGNDDDQAEVDISHVSEKFMVLNGAATCIQKNLKGFITRKRIREIYEQYLAEELEEVAEDTSDESQHEISKLSSPPASSSDIDTNLLNPIEDTAKKIMKRLGDDTDKDILERVSYNGSSEILIQSGEHTGEESKANRVNEPSHDPIYIEPGNNDNQKKGLTRDKSQFQLHPIQKQNVEKETITENVELVLKSPQQEEVVNCILDKYQTFAKQQLNNWNQVNQIVESLQKRKEKTSLENSIKETLEQLHTASEVNIHALQTSIRNIEVLSRDPSRATLNPPSKQPIKPGLVLDIQRVANAFEAGTEELKGLNIGNSNYSKEGDNLLSSKSHNKSIERWVDPNSGMAGRKNIELARAILLETSDYLGSNRSSQKHSFNNELK